MSIRLEKVVKTYTSGETTTHALRGVDLTLKTGQFVVVLGPSGSGKSTLLNVMGGLDHVDEGSIIIGEHQIHTMNQKALTLFRRKHVGFVFQQYNLLQTLTVRENVEIGARLVEKPRDIDDILTRVGLKDHREKYPFQLSGGEQQRVAIARALVKNPELLFCDEPTGALDEKTAKEILSLLQELNKTLKTTVIFITHNAAIADIADVVVRMNSGNIAEIKEVQSKRLAKDISWA